MHPLELIVLADLASVKAYRLEPRQGHPPFPRLVETTEFREAHDREQDLVTDATGRFHNKISSSPGFVSETGERLGLEAEIHQRLVKKITHCVLRFLEKYQPSSWGFAAASEINEPIVKEIAAPWPQRLSLNLAKNLMKIKPEELLSHFNK